MVLHYNEVKNVFQYESLRKWFSELFKDDQNGVVAISLDDPYPGALHWLVADPEKAKVMREKYKVRGRVWTLNEINEYLECFKDRAKDVLDAALIFTGEKQSNANVPGGNDSQARPGPSAVRECLPEGEDRNSLLPPPDTAGGSINEGVEGSSPT